MNLQQALKPYRAKMNLAKSLGISMTWMSLIVSGKKHPSLKLALRIQERTGVLVSDFWGQPSLPSPDDAPAPQINFSESAA